MSKIVQSNNLFLTADPKKKDVEPSPLAAKAIAKAPPNLAFYDDKDQLHEVCAHVLRLAQQAYSAYQNQWSSLQEKWEKADEMYWMEQKESRLSELTRAKVSASVYHRVVRRLADGAYLASFTDDMPVKFFPDIGTFEPSNTKHRKAVVAEALNRWAQYCMRKTNMKEKSRKSFLNIYKYGNHIVYVPYDFKIEKRKRYEPRDVNKPFKNSLGEISFEHSDTGDISNQPHPPILEEVEYDHIVSDEVGFHPQDIDRCFLDNTIDDLDRQTFFFWRSDITRPELWEEAKAGKFMNINRISQLQQFQQYNWQNQAQNQRITDSGKTATDSYQSEKYERWQVWILMPKLKLKYNKKGEVADYEWDQDGEPRRYVLDVVGDIGNNSCIVVRFSESPYWGNGIPFISAHSHEDDSGWWHRGLQELLEDNMIQEQTAKGQLMDNRTMRTFMPTIRLVGRVKNKDMRITHNTTFDVTSPDAIQFMQIPDITGNIENSLRYLKDDSEAVAQTPPFFMGENLGSRTSATEFASIRDQSSAPALNDIKKINMQICGGYMRKLKEYAPQFLDKDVAVQVDGAQGAEALTIMVGPDEFNADMMIEEVSVQEFENKTTARQILLNLVQVVVNPVFAPFLNVGGLLYKILKSFSTIFPNPEEILNTDSDAMELMRKYLAQNPIPEQAAGNQQVPMLGGQPLNPNSGSQPINVVPIPENHQGNFEAGPLAALAGQTGGT